MRPVGFTSSQPDANGHAGDELAFVNPRNGHGVHTARQNVDRAIQFLLATFGKSAILLARDWDANGDSFEFEHLDTYKEIAGASNLFVLAATRPEAGGHEHLLFVTRSEGLTDTELFACLPSGPPMENAL